MSRFVGRKSDVSPDAGATEDGAPRPGVVPSAGAYHERLRRTIGVYPSLIVAYSGGVDSALLAFVTHEVLGDRMLAAIAVSPSLPQSEENEALGFLAANGIPCERIVTGEIDKIEYRRNNPDRCYHCKSELFSKLRDLAESRGYARVAYGANAADDADYRPGSKAASEGAIVAPLAEAGLDKRAVREVAKSLGLDVWDKPSSPCLASRIPYYEVVTREKLSQIEKAELVLRENGFRICRVRHHGDLARIEIPREEHPRILETFVWRSVTDGIRAAGFRHVTLDLDGFRSGSLNDVLRKR